MYEKLLFLDIDGVLNVPSAELGWKYVLGRDKEDDPNWKTQYGTVLNYLSEAFCVSSLYNLYRIVEETGCEIVISSVWRYGEPLENMKAWFPCQILKDAVIDGTPAMRDAERGDEIQEYLKGKLVKKFAVVDDDDDMSAVWENFFQTDSLIGLDYHTSTKIINHLGKKEEEHEQPRSK